MPPLTLELSRAALALRDSHRPALRRLGIEETDTRILLTGTVSSYYMKQLAQETVMPFLTGRQLHNRVTVAPEVLGPAD